MLLLGRVPSVSDAVEWQGWRFEIVDMDGHRIDKVLAVRLPQSLSAADSLPLR
jgi:putative hemolysin